MNKQLNLEQLKNFKSILKDGKERIKNTYFQTHNAKQLLAEHSKLIDNILCELWNIFLSNCYEKNNNNSNERYAPALVAVGGYGRQELYPHSDIDLLIILAQSATTELSESIENLITVLWDLGLKIGHSVRTIPECLYDSKNDITVQTNFLDSRFLIGNSSLFFAFQTRLKGQLDPLKFFHDKLLEKNERHQRFENTPYNLEPNIKESPGALRDIHLMFWIGKSLGLQNIPNDFLKYNLITEDGIIAFNRNYEFLQHLRINLHYYKNREEDRLLFDYQEKIATLFYEFDNKNYSYFSDFYNKNNYQNLVENRLSNVNNDNVEDNPKKLISKFMQIYYRCVKTVMLIHTIVEQNISTFLEPETMLSAKIIDNEFQQIGNLLDVRNTALFANDNTAIFRACLTLQKYAKTNNLVGMTAPTLRALWITKNRILRSENTLIEFRSNKINQRNFLNLFASDNNVYQEIKRLNQLEILSLYLPVFNNIVGQMQYDLCHVYTVDQHSLEVLKNLRKFKLSEYAHEYPQCSRILDEFERPYILYLAALFHDIAKGRGGDHSELGAIDAENFCKAHNAIFDELSGNESQADQQLLSWLVKYHLVFSKVAQKQDISDPEVIIKFADFVKTKRNLDALYLLTHADIRGTSPKVWNQWKNKLLNELYNLTNQELVLRSQNNNTNKNNDINKSGIIAEKQQQALQLLRYFALPETVHERLWSQLDNVYFLRHSADEIAWHTKYLHYRIFDKKPIIAARKLSIEDVEEISNSEYKEYNNSYIFQVMVYTSDTNDLFSKLVGYFTKYNYSIVDAKIHTTIHKYALDSFTLTSINKSENKNDTNDEIFDEKEFLSTIENELSQRLNNMQTFNDIPNISQRFIMSRQVKNFPIKPDITIRRDASYFNYILTLSAVDKPGLLYLISKELADNNIVLHSAKIATLGERAEDVFLISGTYLEDENFRIQLERKLIRVIS